MNRTHPNPVSHATAGVFAFAGIILAHDCGDAPVLGPTEGAPIAPFMQSPFTGDFPVTSVFDHDLPILWREDNHYQLAWWGEPLPGLDGHQGYDWVMPEGTPIYAAAAGLVTGAGLGSEQFCPPLQRRVRTVGVTILHETPEGERFQSLYSHASRVEVAVGDRVAAGQLIAISGNTGCSTGPHLHFQVDYIARRSAPTVAGALGLPVDLRVPVDPYGWDGPNADPWAHTSLGNRSWNLWIEGMSPRLRRGPWEFPSPPAIDSVPVVIVGWVATGVRDESNLNNEVVELAVNPLFGNASPVDMTGFTLENNAGDRFAFPFGFQLVTGRNVRVYTGTGSDTSTDLYWGRTTQAWDNSGDCVTLRAPDGTPTYRLQNLAGCQD